MRTWQNMMKNDSTYRLYLIEIYYIVRLSKQISAWRSEISCPLRNRHILIYGLDYGYFVEFLLHVRCVFMHYWLYFMFTLIQYIYPKCGYTTHTNIHVQYYFFSSCHSAHASTYERFLRITSSWVKFGDYLGECTGLCCGRLERIY